MSTSLIFFVVAVLIVGVLLFMMISLTKSKGVVLNREEYQTHWLNIEQAVQKDNPPTFKIAILEADKLVDKAMIELGVVGNTFADRLKKSGPKFSSVQSLWHAHKLRNQIAHEAGFSVNYDQTKRALNNFRQALKDLGAV
jgi:hypothetical protein